MPLPIYLALSEDDFRKLVAGQIAGLRTTDGQAVNVILSDIGRDRMLAAINDAAHSGADGTNANPR